MNLDTCALVNLVQTGRNRLFLMHLAPWPQLPIAFKSIPLEAQQYLSAGLTTESLRGDSPPPDPQALSKRNR